MVVLGYMILPCSQEFIALIAMKGIYHAHRNKILRESSMTDVALGAMSLYRILSSLSTLHELF